jgi:membrane protease YdiL (CAAX protease family)
VLYAIKLKVKPKDVFEHCNFFKINIHVVLISIGLGIICFIINVAIASLFNGILIFSGYQFPNYASSGGDYSVGNFFLQLFLVALLPAICEEFLHRGIVLQGIKHAGFKKAIVISSLLFALMHFNIQQVSYAFVIGLILGFVAVVAKNIYPAMIIHFVNNAIATYLDFADYNDWWLGDVLDKLQGFLSSNSASVIFMSVSLFMVIIVALLFVLIWLLYKQAIVRKVNKAINKAYDNFSMYTQNKPIRLGEEHEVMMDLLEKNTLLNLDFKPMGNPIDIVLPKERSRYKTTKKDLIFLWGAILLGGLITLFTYIWGLL